MLDSLLTTAAQVLATESGIPTSNPWSKAAVPLGFLIFVGGVYLLVRSNLGTRRGYLVTATSFFGFAFVLALFWTFGAPGTPPNTGPQNLPGQDLEAYLPVWRPFAPDSTLAVEEYAFTQDYPEGFEPVPEHLEVLAAEGAREVVTFFSSLPEPYDPVVASTDVGAEDEILYYENPDGYDVIAVPVYPSYQLEPIPGDAPEGFDPQLTVGGEAAEEDGSNVAPEGAEAGEIATEAEPVLLFAYFDPGAESFPSFLTLGLITLLFALHMALLYRDERREHREREESRAATAPPPQPEPAEPVNA